MMLSSVYGISKSDDIRSAERSLRQPCSYQHWHSSVGQGERKVGSLQGETLPLACPGAESRSGLFQNDRFGQTTPSTTQQTLVVLLSS